MTTINDLAKTLGVAPSTISRALAGSREVSEETRQHVITLAKKMNYTPNLWARNLARSKTDTIGCVILQFANTFFIPVIEAIEDIADVHGYSVITSQSRRLVELEKRIVRRLQMMQIGGLIITPILDDVSHLLALKKTGIPIIMVGRTHPQFECISIDNYKGGQIVAAYLLERGFSEIGAVISGEKTNEPEQYRIKGLRRTLGENGLTLSEKWTMIVGSNNPEGGMRAAHMWLKFERKPRAVFCSNDQLAIGFMQAIRAYGKRIPEDVAVVGFDDIPFLDYMAVPLTTVAFPKYEMGKIAAQNIIRMMNCEKGEEKDGHIFLKPHLVVRASV